MSNRNLAASARRMLLRRGRALLREGRVAATRGPIGGVSDLAEPSRRELAEIHAALERIERGTYGRCDRCFGGIAVDRLEAVPWERYCATCREREAVAGAPPSL